MKKRKLFEGEKIMGDCWITGKQLVVDFSQQ